MIGNEIDSNEKSEVAKRDFNDAVGEAKRNLSAGAYYKLGSYYQHGHGIAADPERAFKYFQKSVKFNPSMSAAWKSLADCYKEGIGIVADEKMAAFCLEIASGSEICEQEMKSREKQIMNLKKDNENKAAEIETFKKRLEDEAVKLEKALLENTALKARDTLNETGSADLGNRFVQDRDEDSTSEFFIVDGNEEPASLEISAPAETVHNRTLEISRKNFTKAWESGRRAATQTQAKSRPTLTYLMEKKRYTEKEAAAYLKAYDSHLKTPEEQNLWNAAQVGNRAARRGSNKPSVEYLKSILGFNDEMVEKCLNAYVRSKLDKDGQEWRNIKCGHKRSEVITSLLERFNSFLNSTEDESKKKRAEEAKQQGIAFQGRRSIDPKKIQEKYNYSDVETDAFKLGVLMSLQQGPGKKKVRYVL